MAQYADAIDQLASTDLWKHAAVVYAAFLLPSVVRNLAEGRTGFDIPDEVYGAVVVAGSSFMPMYEFEIALGGGLYTTDKLAERVDLKQTVTGMGA